MNNINFKGEEFLDTSYSLFEKLNAICNTLINNLRTSNKNNTVEDIIKSKSFNELWSYTSNVPDKTNSKKEFKGLYGFASVENDEIKFMYIGISQRTRGRFKDHTWNKKSNDASWAYLMAKHRYPDLSRKELEKFISEYQKTIIYPLKFTFCPIEDNMLLYLAEIYCVNKLKSYWNTFETH